MDQLEVATAGEGLSLLRWRRAGEVIGEMLMDAHARAHLARLLA